MFKGVLCINSSNKIFCANQTRKEKDKIYFTCGNCDYGKLFYIRSKHKLNKYECDICSSHLRINKNNEYENYIEDGSRFI